MKIWIAVLLLGVASPAFADAAASFHDGKWPAVIAQGRAEATPASLVLAGRAALVQAAYGTTDKAQALDLIAAAERDFDAALVKAPGNSDAQFQKSVATGYRAKLTKSPGLGKESRRGFEAYRAARPNDALGWSAVAGWHGGAVATLGSFMAGTVLGARAVEVDSGFSRAIRLDPTNPVHRVFHAQTLLDLDAGNAAKAAATLQGVGQMPARDGYEAMLRAQGVQIAAALKAGDAKAAQKLSRRLAAFGGLG
ncbi:MAG: hypothetical protein H7268_02775 [Sandarakinorhabdus sp.]|nr:hypothetical protein [Sandarakinorhabdus sp.]